MVGISRRTAPVARRPRRLGRGLPSPAPRAPGASPPLPAWRGSHCKASHTSRDCSKQHAQAQS
eukprot:12976107-Alexandrium_andersonii.AAC.1